MHRTTPISSEFNTNPDMNIQEIDRISNRNAYIPKYH